MIRPALVALASLSLGVTIGLLLRPSGPAVLVRFDADGTPRAFGPASPAVAGAARLAVGGRVVRLVPLP